MRAYSGLGISLLDVNPGDPTPWYGMEELPARPGEYELWVNGNVTRARFDVFLAAWSGLNPDVLRPAGLWKNMRWRGVFSDANCSTWQPPWTSVYQSTKPPVGLPEERWVMRNGRQVNVGDMNMEHLRDTLRMILRVRREVKEAERKARRERWNAR